MNSMSSDDAYNAWRQEAQSADLVAYVNGQRGGDLKRAGHEWVGPCPGCGGHDRFSINPNKKIFNCRGHGGGDYIKAVMHIDDCDFMAACEALTGYRPEQLGKRERSAPRKRSSAPPPSPPPAEDPAPPHPSRPAPTRGKMTPQDIFAMGVPIMGTHGEAYLAARNLDPSPDWLGDFRFIPDLAYYGYEDADADKLVGMGRYPAIVAAIRDASGSIIAVHRTYLDPDAPRKMQPVGDLRRNGVKKISGSFGGGGIWLSRPSATVVIGEGYETTRSAELLGIGSDTATYCTAVSLGNLAGSCTGSINHPSIDKRKIPNGQPDMERPGLILPDSVYEVIILGDGDSDPAMTHGYLLAAGRRWQAEGRSVLYALAPDGQDWNDVLMASGSAPC